MTTLSWIFASALLSSLTTLGLAYLVYRAFGRASLEAELAVMQSQFEQRVKSGVLAAGRELLPELRREVAAGFEDALRKSHAAGLAEDAAKVMTGAAGIAGDAARGAAGLVESSLGSLFGLKPRT